MLNGYAVGVVTLDGGLTLDYVNLENLTITNGSTLTSGPLTIEFTVDVTGPTTFDRITADNTASGAVIEVGLGGATMLTLDDGTAIDGGHLDLDSGSTLYIEKGGDAGGPYGATLDDVTVTGGGAIEVGLTSTATLTLDGGTTITAGTATINAGSALDVQSPGGATLTGVDITNTGTVDVESNTLVINDEGGGSFTNFVLAAEGTLQVDAGATLNLENVTISGGNVVVNGLVNGTGTLGAGDVSAIDNANVTTGSTGKIEATIGTLTIDPGTLSNGGILEANGATLVIDDAVTDTGGSAIIAAGGTLEFGADASDAQALTFNGAGTLKLDSATAFTGTVALASGDVLDLNFSNDATLDLSSGDLSGFKTITLSGGDDTLTLSGASISVTVTGTGDTIILGGGTDTVVGGSGNTVTLGTGTAKVSFTSGTNTVNATIGTGATLLTSDNLAGGSGTDTLAISGSNGSINLGSLVAFTGFEDITLSGNNDVLTLGNNALTVTITGTGDTVVLGSVADTVIGGSGNTVTLAVGTANVSFTGGTNTVLAVSELHIGRYDHGRHWHRHGSANGHQRRDGNRCAVCPCDRGRGAEAGRH